MPWLAVVAVETRVSGLPRSSKQLVGWVLDCRIVAIPKPRYWGSKWYVLGDSTMGPVLRCLRRLRRLRAASSRPKTVSQSSVIHSLSTNSSPKAVTAREVAASSQDHECEVVGE